MQKPFDKTPLATTRLNFQKWLSFWKMFAIFATAVFITIPLAKGQETPQYQLIWLGEGRPRDINEAGLVAFGWSSFIYDHNNATKIDLNDPQYGATWVDLEDQADETGNWTVWHCNGVNESGQIIGTASHIPGIEADRNFVLNDPLGSPVFELVPTNILDGSTYNVCINDAGDVAVGREINNNGVVAGGESVGAPQGTVVLPDGSFESFEGHYFTGINEAGFITGYRESKKGKNGWGNSGPILFDYPGAPGSEDLIQSGTATNYHGDLNNWNNVAYSSGGAGFLYVFETDTSFNLDNLIVNDPSSQDYTNWINTTIYPSGINDKDQIIGQAKIDGVWNGFILNPITPGPGISVSPLDGLTTTEENAGQATFEVVLNTEPTADVTIGISSDNTTEGTVDKSSLVFTPANWDQPQTVTVTGVDDAIEDGDIAYTILTAAATSSDPDYNGLVVDDVSVTNEDDDGPVGGTKTYSSGNIRLNIPDNDPGGVSHTIGVGSGDSVQIVSLTITLDISHSRPADLSVTLMGPGGTEVTLTNYGGDNNVTAFNGTSTQGLWTLKAVDDVGGRKGKINSWTIKADY